MKCLAQSMAKTESTKVSITDMMGVLDGDFAVREERIR